ncbi:hypothetical protein LCGC14_2946810 [marine sediment metagenome]|uniref:PIN domain-containing protein n=1 Tax=marine sediment metagenome TaxID=412755 RepID=A0A0F8ZP47_9ZZZZ
MKLIIDTNILISSLLKDSTTREILLNESLNFYLPELVLSETNKYLPYIIQKSELNEKEIKKLLNTLLENLILVPIDEYEKKMDEGMKIIGKIDEKDTQFIALALSIEMMEYGLMINILKSKRKLEYLKRWISLIF